MLGADLVLKDPIAGTAGPQPKAKTGDVIVPNDALGFGRVECLRTVLRAVRLTVLRGASAAITRNTDGAAQVLKLAATRCNAANDEMCHEPTSRPLSEAQKFD